jgi:hypothetical protein
VVGIRPEGAIFAKCVSQPEDIKRTYLYLRLKPSVKQPEEVMTMSALVITAAEDLIQSAIDVVPTWRVSPVDTWIGGRVRIKRTSRGISGQEFCSALSIDGDELAAFEAGEKRINANLLFRIAKLMDVRPDYFFRGYTD